MISRWTDSSGTLRVGVSESVSDDADPATALRVTAHLFYRDLHIAQGVKLGDLAVVTPNYSPMLHNYILAVALAFSDHPHLRATSTRRIFAAEGARSLDRECASPSIASVQGLVIRASWMSSMGDYSLGWVNHGLANRLSYARA